jgi:hypothetical protein
MSRPSEPRSLLASSSVLPDDLLEEARKRIGVAGLVIAAIWFVIIVFIGIAGRFFASALPNVEATWPEPGRYFAITGILAGLGLAFVARRVGPRSHWLRDAAALLMVGTCLMLAILESRVPVTQPGRLSWVNVVILLYPLIVAESPRRTLVGWRCRGRPSRWSCWASPPSSPPRSPWSPPGSSASWVRP